MSRLDEIVAVNVKRLREDKKWKPSTLAGVMDLPKHVVYDMERPRKGQQQRSFSWTEIVTLCKALETTLYELVLPEEGEEHRDELGWRLFGVGGENLTGEPLEKLDRLLKGYLNRRDAEIRSWLATHAGVGTEEVKTTVNPATGRTDKYEVPFDLMGYGRAVDQQEEE